MPLPIKPPCSHTFHQAPLRQPNVAGNQSSQGQPRERASHRGDQPVGGTQCQGRQAVKPACNSQSLRGKDRNRDPAEAPAHHLWPWCRAVASRGRVSGEQIEVPAQGATVLRHLLAPVELCAGGIAFALLDKSVHLERQKPRVQSLRIWCFHRKGGETAAVTGQGRRKAQHPGEQKVHRARLSDLL